MFQEVLCVPVVVYSLLIFIVFSFAAGSGVAISGDCALE